MSFVNYSSREINCKVVYCGPGLSGKTTNLRHIYQQTKPEARGQMVALATETQRTLFFDFLPLALGDIRGFKTRFHLYTVPGQSFYRASRKLILKGVDGVVFVADSQVERGEANLQALEDLRQNLADQKETLERLPCVFQYNKQDLPHAASSDALRDILNPGGLPDFTAQAVRGEGVFETLRGIARLVLAELKDGAPP